MKNLEVDKGWLWVVVITYIAYTIAMLLPLLSHLYILAWLGVNNAVNFDQIQAMRILAFVWFVSTLILSAIGLFVSQYITMKRRSHTSI